MSELQRGYWYLQSNGTVQYLSETDTIITFYDGPMKLGGTTIKDKQPLEVVKAGTVAGKDNRIAQLEKELEAAASVHDDNEAQTITDQKRIAELEKERDEAKRSQQEMSFRADMLCQQYDELESAQSGWLPSESEYRRLIECALSWAHTVESEFGVMGDPPDWDIIFVQELEELQEKNK